MPEPTFFDFDSHRTLESRSLRQVAIQRPVRRRIDRRAGLKQKLLNPRFRGLVVVSTEH